VWWPLSWSPGCAPDTGAADHTHMGTWLGKNLFE
jgi:hypothetical protein